MGNVITNLKAKFGVDTSDFKKGLKDGEKATEDFKDAASGTLDQFASMFGVNMGAVNDALSTANKSLNFVSQSMKAAATTSGTFSAALKILKFAITATGIGAIVVALGSVIAYFQKAGEGADKFAKILMQIKSVVNNVIERFAVFGKGLWQLMTGKFREGWETMRSAFKGIGDEIKEDWKAAGALAEREDALEDREIALINSLEERRAKAAELRLLAKEEMEDQRKKLSLLNQAETTIRSVYADQISLERERLDIMKEKLALQTTDPTDEQNREIAEQEAVINSLLREQATELKGLTRERNTARAIVEEEVKLEKMKAEQVGITVAAISQLQMPNLSQGLSSLREFSANVATVTKNVSESMQDMARAIEQTITQALVGFGQWLGEFAAGTADMGDLSKMIGSVLGNMLTRLGEVAIETGVGLLAIKEAFSTGDGYAAIAAGVALVAFGAMISNSISSIGKSTFSGGGSGGHVYDVTNSSGPSVYKAAGMTFSGEIALTAKGSDLVAVINKENLRVSKTT